MISIYNRNLLNKCYNINNLINLISNYSNINKNDIISFLNKDDNELIIVNNNNNDIIGFILGEYIMFNTLTYKINVIYFKNNEYFNYLVKELINYLKKQSIFKIISNYKLNNQFKLLKYQGKPGLMNQFNFIYELSF